MHPLTLFLDGLALAGGVLAVGGALLLLAGATLWALAGLKRGQ